MEPSKKKSSNEENSPMTQANKLIKRIWYLTFAVGAIAVMLQDKFTFKEMFWVISISTLFLAFTCAIMLFKKGFSLVERFIYTVATITLIFVDPHWLDIPAFLTNDNKVVQGVPTEFDYRTPYKAGSYLHVEVDNVELRLPSSIPSSKSDRWFVIHYLPNSKFITDYKILTKEETLHMQNGE